MLKLILNIIFFIVLAIFTAMNVSATTDINLFGWSVTDVSVVAIILISVAVGILYSFIYYIGNFMAKRSKNKFRNNQTKHIAKEKELNEREKLIQQTVESIPQKLINPAEVPEAEPVKTKRKFLSSKKDIPTDSPDQVPAVENIPVIDQTLSDTAEKPSKKKRKLFK